MKPTILLAATALLAACGSTEREPGRDRAFDGAVEFAQCMRDNGVDVPDPQQGEGGMVRLARGAFDPSDPAVERARGRCERHLREGMPRLSAAEQAKARDAFVDYAACMRKAGIDLPDPGADGSLLLRPGGAVDPESPAFREADAGCRTHLADLPGLR
jgi:hypothetical protein